MQLRIVLPEVDIGPDMPLSMLGTVQFLLEEENFGEFGTFKHAATGVWYWRPGFQGVSNVSMLFARRKL